MTLITDLAPWDDFQAAITDGFASRRQHGSAPLDILNYTKPAQHDPSTFDRYPALKHCRGLIFNRETLEVVARPWAKFWNYGEGRAATIPLDAEVEVVDKLDGSLGIIYSTGDDVAVATRGSFDSPQAKVATEMLRYDYGVVPDDLPAGLTILVEIIYPENRIVVDYGNDAKLILLGAVDDETGAALGPLDAWGALSRTGYGWYAKDVAEVLPYHTLREALEAEPRLNAEGVVVRHGSAMVKVKQDDYRRLHRALFGLNELSIWEAQRDGVELGTFLSPLPEEVHPWVNEVWGQMLADGFRLTAAVRASLASLRWHHSLSPRGAVAQGIRDHAGKLPHAPLPPKAMEAALFAAYDEDWPRLAKIVHRSLRPSGGGGRPLVGSDTLAAVA